jgi:hypothetical protein
MADVQAIGAVSTVLRQVLSDGLGGVQVGLRPPDLMDGDGVESGLNLYLYQVERSGRWHNLPNPPSRALKSPTPLALILRYLLTAYGEDDLAAQDALETALSLLTDSAILSPALVRAVAPGSTLAKQVEPVRLTLVNIESRDLFHLWSTFQAPYRTSVLFEVEVVLVPSKRPAPAPVPVLQRGPGDAGPGVDRGLSPPFPTIDSIEPPAGAALGDRLTLRGTRLGSVTIVRLTPSPEATPDAPEVLLDVAPVDRSETAVAVDLDAAEGPWRAGAYRAAALTPEASTPGVAVDFERESGPIGLDLLPTITSIAVNGGAAVADPGGAAPAPTVQAVAQGAARRVVVAVAASPPVGASQSASLLLNGRQAPRDAGAAGLQFTATGVDVGTYWLRLRVDGVDSRLADRSTTPPTFRAFRLEVTA